MCDGIGWDSDWPEITLDSLLSHVYLMAVRARSQEYTPDEVFNVRIKTKLTQVDFAALVGVTPITVSRWERGVTKVSDAYTVTIRTRVKEYEKKRA